MHFDDDVTYTQVAAGERHTVLPRNDGDRSLATLLPADEGDMNRADYHTRNTPPMCIAAALFLGFHKF